MAPQHSNQQWTAQTYAQNGRFVANLASAVMALLDPQPGERILDAGCGDGALTAQIAAAGALVVGVDASAGMLEGARARGLHADGHDLIRLPYTAEFDAVFSNAALHWVALEDQLTMLEGLRRALKSGGRLVAEMGGQGNIAAIRTALSAVLAPHGLDPEALAASYYPSAENYRALLTQAGFAVETLELIPRPTPLPGGMDGMRVWLETFRNGVLDPLPGPARARALEQTIALLRPVLSDHTTGEWTADYVRLRFSARSR